MTVISTWASFPVPELTSQVRMGLGLIEDPATDFWWNRQLDDGSYTVINLDDWQKLTFVTPIDEVGGRDGGLDGPPSVAPKSLSAEALVVAPTAELLWQNIARVRRLLGGGQATGLRPAIYVEQYDWGAGERLALRVRPEGDFTAPPVSGHVPGGLAAPFRFSLVAANPPWKLKAGPVEEAQAGLLNPALISGRTYDKTYDYTYGSSSAPGGELVANNTGDLPAQPLFVVKGTANNPIIHNVTTGQEFQVLASLGDSDTVTIDTRTGIVAPGNVRLSGRPFLLAPGINTIRWRDANDAYDPDALLTVQWRSTYA